MKVSVQENRHYFTNRTVKHLAGCFSVVCRRLAMPLVGEKHPPMYAKYSLVFFPLPNYQLIINYYGLLKSSNENQHYS